MKNKELTMQKLISSVGCIIRNKGYKGLGVNAIAREAGVHKKLIYRYFGTVDQLIETYVIEKDYWLSFNKKIEESLPQIDQQNDLEEILASILEKQFEFFFNEEEMQKIILWEISEETVLLNGICKVREEFGDLILNKTDEFFKGSGTNLRAVCALLVCGIYYMVLHAKKNDSTICGINVNSDQGKAEISKTIRQVIKWSFDLKKGQEPVIPN
eukprot:gene18115-21614_t